VPPATAMRAIPLPAQQQQLHQPSSRALQQNVVNNQLNLEMEQIQQPNLKRHFDQLEKDIAWYVHYAACIEYFKDHTFEELSNSPIYKCLLIGFGDNGSHFIYEGNIGGFIKYHRDLRMKLPTVLCHENKYHQRILLLEELVKLG
jgi:hypothetical protein